MKKVSLITDGSCLGNPGPGGWACVLRFGGVKKEFFGFDPHTTNNRMELMAPIQGLLALKEPCEVEITTDSEYVLYGITKWVIKWKQRHWWPKHGPVRNADLWMELDELASLHQTNWVWTKGTPRGQQPVRLVGTECGGHSAKFLGRRPTARNSSPQPRPGLRAA
jgi:ribonuclease HI